MCSKPKANEDEYFARIEFERRRDLARKSAAKFLPEKRTSLKAVLWTRCRTEGSDVVAIDFRGLGTDGGTQCGGLRPEPGVTESVT